MHSNFTMKCMENYSMKLLTLLLLSFLLLHAEDTIMVVKDRSGLSDDAIRQKAKESDKKVKRELDIKDIYALMDKNGKVDLAKLEAKWESLSPTPVKYDWVQTKSGEWFKGTIKSLYHNKLEFDSNEIGLYTFNLDNVTQIKSYHLMSVNIENLASIKGVLRFKNGELSIIQGKNRYKFNKEKVISFAPDGAKERNLWSGKVAIGFDIRSGNSDQQDFSATVNLQRRSSQSHLTLGYLGRTSSKNGMKISNNHRLNEKYDLYLSRNFFWTPLFSELYTDTFKNIAVQLTAGFGMGYTFLDTKKTFWSFSGGPAFVYTRHSTVETATNKDSFSPALEVSTKYKLKLNRISDLKYDYKLTYTTDTAGTYKHHMVLVLENELFSWLDFDISGIWDYVKSPTAASDGTVPLQNDFQMIMGFGTTF